MTAPLAERRGFSDADLRYVRRALSAGRVARAASDLAAAGASDSRLRALARRVRTMQENDIGELAALLDGWGRREDLEPVDPLTRSPLPAVAVRDRPSLSGLEADRRFIDSLIAHAEGAIASARIEVIEGFHPASRRAAQATIRANYRCLGALRRLVPGAVPGGRVRLWRGSSSSPRRGGW